MKKILLLILLPPLFAATTGILQKQENGIVLEILFSEKEIGLPVIYYGDENNLLLVIRNGSDTAFVFRGNSTKGWDIPDFRFELKVKDSTYSIRSILGLWGSGISTIPAGGSDTGKVNFTNADRLADLKQQGNWQGFPEFDSDSAELTVVYFQRKYVSIPNNGIWNESETQAIRSKKYLVNIRRSRQKK